MIEHIGSSSCEMLAAFGQQRFAARAAGGTCGPAQRLAVFQRRVPTAPAFLRIGNHDAHIAALQLTNLFQGKKPSLATTVSPRFSRSLVARATSTIVPTATTTRYAMLVSLAAASPKRAVTH